MRIVTFNVRHAATADDRVDTDLLARSCAGLGADLLALQEVDVGGRRSGGADQAAAVARATGMRHVFGRASRGPLGGSFGNALLSRDGLDAVAVLGLPRRRRRGRARRSVILAEVTVGDRRLSVAATHLSVHGDESPGQLAAVVSALAARPRPRVLLGDLNLGPAEVTPVVERAGMRLADPTVASFPADAPRLRIDHVAVDGLDIVSVEVLDRLPVSDHRPVRVGLG